MTPIPNWPRAACQVAISLALGACAGPQTPLREAPSRLAAHEQLLTIPTRPGVTVRVLVTKPRAEPSGLVLFYPGGEGWLVSSSGSFYNAWRHEFAQAGYVFAIVDVPSDHGVGMLVPPGDSFRIAQGHTDDARVVVRVLRESWPLRFLVMGHSMGAISAAHLGATLGDAALAGVVLLGSAGHRGPHGSWASIHHAQPGRVKVPVLVVHHQEDGCPGTPFATATGHPALFRSSSRAGLVEVIGGPPSQSPNPCEGNNKHSFIGQRGLVTNTVLRWFAGEDLRRVGD